MNESKRVTKGNFALEVKNSDAIGFVHKNGSHYNCPKPGRTQPDTTIITAQNGYQVKCECGALSDVFTFDEMKLPHPIWGISYAK